MRIKSLVALSLLISPLLNSCNNVIETSDDLILWYDTPSTEFYEALPIGNGRLGATIYGGAQKETISLNEETLWAGGPGNNLIEGFNSELPKIRQLIAEGKNKEAEIILDNFSPKGYKKSNAGMPYQCVGDIIINNNNMGQVSEYRRELDLSTAIATTKYKQSGINYTTRSIVSLVDNIIVTEITADKKNSINIGLTVTSMQPNHTTDVSNNAIYLKGVSTDFENKKGEVEFTTIVKPKIESGFAEYRGDKIIISAATKVTIYTSIATNFASYNDLTIDENQKAQSILDKAYGKDFDKMAKKHTAKFKSMFDRVDLNFGADSFKEIPTDERLANFSTKSDPQFMEILFQYGRYLLISSSQPGGQAANLQGIWCKDLRPAWDSKYTLNINLEMNYWLAMSTNLFEVQEPLLSLIEDLSVVGKESAEKMYGARGWNAHHNTDIWRITGIVDGAFHGTWPTSGGWLVQHIWLQYLYSGDIDFLRKYYPIIKGAALFYRDMLIKEHRNEWMVISPSNSPEHAMPSCGSPISEGATMDNQLITDLFGYVITASEVLDTDKDFASELKAILPQTAPMQIGSWGQLQEWLDDVDSPKDDHRHKSHLYGLYPSNQITPIRTPELAAAAKTTIYARGLMSTGWAMAWNICFAARLLDSELLTKSINLGITPAIKKGSSKAEYGGLYPNLTNCAHNHLQLDGTFGTTAGIAEMIMQSHDGAIHLIPTLPVGLETGSVKGLRARGGFVVDMEWNEGEVESCTIESTIGGVCRVRSHTPLKGKNIEEAIGNVDNLFLTTPTINRPINNSLNPIETDKLREYYEYDIKTTKGEKITLYRN
ncbi:MAG: glycoside hydrolase family 95 protein [Rikenellaceae bacterium]